MKSSLNVLVISTFAPGNANVIRDFLFAFNEHSRNNHYYVFDPQIIDSRFDFAPYDVVVIFWSVYLLGPNLSPAARERIREARALKVLFLQDEYRDVRKFNAVMADLGINIMCTCVAEADHEKFYPKALIPSLKAVHTVLTGYVPASLDAGPPDLSTPRSIDIGYRSRAVPWVLGDLGQEKTVIATKFQEISRRYGFKSDISVLESERIYGDAWNRFLRDCRFTLGTESGASLIDFTGEIRQRCEAYLAEHPNATYAELKERFFKDEDHKVTLAAISPRVFESAAVGNVLVMHDGAYSNVVQPDVHFIPVRKDYSNVDEVVAKMRDPELCRRMALRNYDDLVRSGKWGYRRFVSWFDDMIEAHVPTPVRTGFQTRAGYYASRWFAHGQTLVPWGGEYKSLPSRARVGAIPSKAKYQVASFLLQFAMFGLGVLKIGFDVIKPRPSVSPPVIAPVARQREPMKGVVGRFLQDPVTYIKKIGVLAEVLIRERALRRLVWDVWTRLPKAERPSVDQLSEDVVKLALVSRLVRAGGPERPHVRAELDGPTLRLTVGSNGTPPPQNGERRELVERVRAAIVEGGTFGLEWDHSGIGEYADFALGAQRKVRFFVGERGKHRFQALSRLPAPCRSQLWRAVEPIVAPVSH